MTFLKNIVIKIDKTIKEKFYDICHSFNITPMRTILILISRFADGKIDALPIIEDYKAFKEQEVINKTQRILKYRIDGSSAYKINKAKKDVNL